MKLDEFLKAINYQICEGSKFLWQCFGNNARFVDYTSDDLTISASAIYDTNTLQVYNVELYDGTTSVMYRWTDPEYSTKYADEAIATKCNESEEIKIINIEMVEDILEKVSLVSKGLKYDPRVTVPLDLPDDVLYPLMIEAHKRDITLNTLFAEIIENSINKYERDFK